MNECIVIISFPAALVDHNRRKLRIELYIMFRDFNGTIETLQVHHLSLTFNHKLFMFILFINVFKNPLFATVPNRNFI